MKKIKKIIFFLIRFSGIPFLIRNTIQRNNVTIIFYHDIEPVLFEKHIIKLKSLYNIISLQCFINFLETEGRFKLPVKPLIITFDDGHKNNYLLLSSIIKHNIPVTMFLCSHIVGTN